jgi:YD repeat-containing protein
MITKHIYRSSARKFMKMLSLRRTNSLLIVLFLFLVIIPEDSICQTSAVKFHSPNAAGLSKYGDIPVNHHTGVPHISIPIHNITNGRISTSIALSYHSSGVRVDELASWVGLGWSLQGVGMISRSINGGPDEGTGSNASQMPHSGWGWYRDGGIAPGISNCGPQPCNILDPNGNMTAYDGCWGMYRMASKGEIDTEPDMFNFNFGGYSGKFFFDENRVVHMIPETDLVIEPVNSPLYFFAWKIISPNGDRFYFGGSTATEVSYTDGATSYEMNRALVSSTTWHLYRIESANGDDWINFEYDDELYSFGNRGGHLMVYPNSANGTSGGDPVHATADLSKTSVHGKRLRKITTSSGFQEIEFVPSTTLREDVTKYDPNNGGVALYAANESAKSLQYIDVRTGSTCKRFELNQDYFSSATCSACSPLYQGDFDKKRLRLNWVQESVCNGTKLPKHEFTYNTTLLPRRYSLARDWWGYYNGYNSNEGLLETYQNPVPGYTHQTVATPNYRTVNETAMQAGILTRIKYPTGGWTDFSYEAHREPHTPSDLIGGLRIKQVTTSESAGNSIVTDYTYTVGKLYYDPKMYRVLDANANTFHTGAFLGSNDFGIHVSATTSPPMFTSQGYHIGYSQVQVTQNGNGGSVFYYTNEHPVPPPVQFPTKPVVAAIGTSELQREEHYKNAIAPGNLIRISETNRTPIGDVKTFWARKVMNVSCLNCGNSASYGLWIDYNYYTYRYAASSTSEFSDGLWNSTIYQYDAQPKHNGPRSTQMTDSKGRTIKSEYIYASDVGSGAPAAMYDKTNSNFKNMVGAVVEQRTLIDDVVKTKSTTQYTDVSGDILVASSRNYPTGTTDFIEQQFQYHTGSNLASVIKPTGVPNAYLWEYGNNLPVAEVQNAVYQQSITALTPSFSFNATADASCTALTGNFTITESQTVLFAPNVTLNGSNRLWVRLHLKNSSGAVVYSTPIYSANGKYEESKFLLPGTYSFCMEVANVLINQSVSGSFTVNAYSARRTNLVHTSFEQTGIGSTNSKTGGKVWDGVYQVVMPSVSGSYTLTYWRRPHAASAWELVAVPLTLGLSAPPYSIGQTGYYIDELRLHPVDALMTTYTYDPGLGITSSTDPANRTTYFDYDSFGRLMNKRNQDKDIQQTVQYHYKGQN